MKVRRRATRRGTRQIRRVKTTPQFHALSTAEYSGEKRRDTMVRNMKTAPRRMSERMGEWENEQASKRCSRGGTRTCASNPSSEGTKYVGYSWERQRPVQMHAEESQTEGWGSGIRRKTASDPKRRDGEAERERKTENRLESSREINEKYQDTGRRKEARARELKRRHGSWREEDAAQVAGRRRRNGEEEWATREGLRRREKEGLLRWVVDEEGRHCRSTPAEALPWSCFSLVVHRPVWLPPIAGATWKNAVPSRRRKAREQGARRWPTETDW